MGFKKICVSQNFCICWDSVRDLLRKSRSKVQGPCAISFCRSVASSKIMSTVLEPKSRTSKVRTERHILRKVFVRASRLTLLLVKSFVTRMWLWLSTIGGRSMVLLSFALRDKRAHWFSRSSMTDERMGGTRIKEKGGEEL